MSKPRLGGWGGPTALVCLIALFGSPNLAWAKLGEPMTFPTESCPVHHLELDVSYSCTAEFTLRGSNGYRITVSAEAEGGSDEIELSAEGRSGTAQYTVSGKVTADSIKAKFGQLGTVSVRFEPSGRERNVRVPKKCMRNRPRIVTSRLGKFIGTIKFRGERGYTQVAAHSATGGTGDPLANTPKKMQCDFHESDAERKRELESVSLDGAPPGDQIYFSAFRLFGNFPQFIPPGAALPKRDRYLFFVLASEKVEGVSILRSSGAFGTSKDFVFDKSLTSATVRPPSPFTGSGSFLRNADGSTTWTGDLAAPLPGLGTVSLTGGNADLATVAEKVNQIEEGLEK